MGASSPGSLRRRILRISAGAGVVVAAVLSLLALRPRDTLLPIVPDLRAMGIATTWDEYLASLPPRRPTNGAGMLADAVNGAHAEIDGDADLIGREREWSADDRDRAAAMFPALGPWFAGIEAAAACDEIAWRPVSGRVHLFGTGLGFGPMQNGRHLLAARRELASSSADRVRDSRTALELALRFTPMDVLEDVMQRAIVQETVANALRYAETGGPDARDELAMLAAVTPGGWVARGRESLRRELTRWVVAILMAERGEDLQTGDPEIDEAVRELARFPRCPPGAADSPSAYVRSWAAADTEDSSPADWLRRHRSRESSFEGTAGGRAFHLVGLVTPVVAERALRVQAVVDLCRIAAADGDVAAAERAAGGAPLRDPYTGRPYIVERTATHLRLASQGRLDEDPPLDEAELHERGLLWEIPR